VGGGGLYINSVPEIKPRLLSSLPVLIILALLKTKTKKDTGFI